MFICGFSFGCSVIQLERAAMSVGDDYAGRDDEGRDGEADKSLRFARAQHAHTHRREDVRTGFSPTNFKALALLESESLNFLF